MVQSSILSSNASISDLPTVGDVYRKYLIIGGWAIVMTVTVVGNLLVMIAYVKDKKIREQASNLIILHLSIADFLVGTCSLMYPLAFHINNDYLDLGEYGCKFYLIADHVAVVLSMAMILCISFDRYWIVKKNIKYKSFQTRGRIRKMLAVSWISIFVTYCVMILAWDSLPGYEVDNYEDCDSAFKLSVEAYLTLGALTGYIPLVTIATLNTLIFVHLWNHSKLFQKIKVPCNRPSEKGVRDVFMAPPNERVIFMISGRKNSQQRPQDKMRELEIRFRQNSRAAVKLAVLIVVFAMCWMPYEISILYSLHCDDCVSKTVFQILASLQWFNSCINPFLYAATNKRFRDNFKRFLKLRCWSD